MRIAISMLCLALAVAGLGYSQAPAANGLVVRQGEASNSLKDIPQKVMFLKSDSADPKAAIANLLLSDAGIHLLTMGIAPGLAWNPYMSETITKVAKLGKGLISSHANDVKGFEYDTLPGLTAGTTLKRDKVELLIPLDTYRPSADFAVDGIEPVLLRLETRPNDQMRVMASRRVTIKEQKKGRFDMKPTSLREETEVQERTIPIEVERQPGNILRITSREPLEQGEYAVVLRAKSSNGGPTQNIALKPLSAPAPAAATPAPADPMAALMAMQGTAPQQPQRKGLFGGMGKSAPPQAKPEQPAVAGAAGFLAWDFRVIQ